MSLEKLARVRYEWVAIYPGDHCYVAANPSPWLEYVAVSWIFLER